MRSKLKLPYVVVIDRRDTYRVPDSAPASDAPTLLTRADGQPWGLNNLRHTLTKAVADAGLRKGLSFQGLRSGLTAALAERGATDAELGAVTTHAAPNMVAHYRRAADRRTLAASAMAGKRW
ncbi:MAG TPA: tyrosine-type recombinase/integrase [Acetobacteraceae bacterium]|nr:tyrosine-type recombinase/integrase [Acetobacteraceae bacterium]